MIGEIPADADGFLRWCSDQRVHTVVVGSSDTAGQWIGKRVPAPVVPGLLAGEGVAFSDVFLVLTRDGLDTVEPARGAEQLTYFPRKEQGYPDVFLRPDLSTARRLSWHDGTVALNGSYILPNGEPVPIAPRNVLSRLVEQARERGLDVRIGFEFEFYLLKGDLAALESSGYRLQPISTRPYTYNVFRSSIDEPLLSRFRSALSDAGIVVEALNPETGPGQYELNARYADALRAADDAFLYKNAIKELAAREGLLATFMAKPSTEWAGSSCHLHQSLWSPDGAPLVADGHERHGLSKTARFWLGGLLDSMVDFTAVFAPTVNSYKRLAAPYSWAGTTVTWGHDNRSTALRVVGEAPAARRIEHRLGGADANPYLAIAACIAGGLHGLDGAIESPDPYSGDAYADRGLTKLPVTFVEALDRFGASEVVRTWFGADVVEHYVAVKRWEVARYDAHVSDWEVRHYVETA